MAVKATVSMKEYSKDNVTVVTVDCEHSTTTGVLVTPHDGVLLPLDAQIAILCQRALAETPCDCVRALLAEKERL